MSATASKRKRSVSLMNDSYNLLTVSAARHLGRIRVLAARAATRLRLQTGGVRFHLHPRRVSQLPCPMWLTLTMHDASNVSVSLLCAWQRQNSKVLLLHLQNSTKPQSSQSSQALVAVECTCHPHVYVPCSRRPRKTRARPSTSGCRGTRLGRALLVSSTGSTSQT